MKMKNIFAVALLCVIMVLFVACESDDYNPGFEVVEIPTTSEIELNPAESQVNTAINRFAVDVLERILIDRIDDINRIDYGENIAFSPIGAIMSFSLFKNAVDLTKQSSVDLSQLISYKSIDDVNSTISKLMRFLPDESQGGDVCIGNSLWLRNTLVIPEELKDIAHNSFYAELFQYDADNDQDLNDRASKWVNFKTKGEIKTVRLTTDTRANALSSNYFKGEWATKFDKSKTRVGTFYGLKGDSQVDMMSAEIDNVDCYMVEKLVWIALPFKGNYEMQLVLPAQGIPLEDVVYTLNRVNGYAGDKFDIDLRLPKFSLKDCCNLGDYYSGLGSNVTQVANIQVDEDGAKASSVTITEDSGRLPLTFDRPFLYSIVNRTTGTSLMIGAVMRL